MSNYYNPRFPLFENAVNLPRNYARINDLVQDGYIWQDETGMVYDKMRQKRQASKKINIPPVIRKNLNKFLHLYVENIVKIAEICGKNKTQVVFLTQPALWHKGISPEEENLLWLGAVGGSPTTPNIKYLSTTDLETLINSYNEELIRICEEKNIPHLDLANLITKNLEVFYDDCHLNEYGAKRVAQVIASSLKKDGILQ